MKKEGERADAAVGSVLSLPLDLGAENSGNKRWQRLNERASVVNPLFLLPLVTVNIGRLASLTNKVFAPCHVRFEQISFGIPMEKNTGETMESFSLRYLDISTALAPQQESIPVFFLQITFQQSGPDRLTNDLLFFKPCPESFGESR